ncbi:hypothetical protein IHE45_19G181700 [Dioscorea alata]|uniref:Uncharacterized protein n=1 Tax=Dioscorea alata TaxID=55571 RepID=A0ACB7U479_DIOAL|nr:hypothetical protein IHE45_19G181700 [Dioscorea alata]
MRHVADQIDDEGTATMERQRGHVACVENHTSTQSTWNTWRQVGSTRALSPSAISLKQTAHSAEVSSSDCTTTGMDFSASGSSPLASARLKKKGRRLRRSA